MSYNKTKPANITPIQTRIGNGTLNLEAITAALMASARREMGTLFKHYQNDDERAMEGSVGHAGDTFGRSDESGDRVNNPSIHIGTLGAGSINSVGRSKRSGGAAETNV